ncbi:UNVERIFIED_CONTAM: hypothetical protein FKN15_073528 [Acipenser sinensis]
MQLSLDRGGLVQLFITRGGLVQLSFACWGRRGSSLLHWRQQGFSFSHWRHWYLGCFSSCLSLSSRGPTPQPLPVTLGCVHAARPSIGPHPSATLYTCSISSLTRGGTVIPLLDTKCDTMTRVVTSDQKLKGHGLFSECE